MTLSPRLRTIADLVPAGARIADVGTDHGLLVRWLVETKSVERAIASDVAAGPLEGARRHLEGLGSAVEVRQGDGLSVLRPGDVDVVVIAGMGGHRIERLTRGPAEIVGALDALVLQPNNDWAFVRACIRDRGWRLDDEVLVEDAGKFYVVFRVVPGGGTEQVFTWHEADLELGPILRHRRGVTFERWVRARLSDVETALDRAGDRAAPGDPQLRRLSSRRELLRGALR